MPLQDELQKQEQREQEDRERVYLDEALPKVYAYLAAAGIPTPRNMATEKAIVDICDGDPWKVSADHVRQCVENNAQDRARLGVPESVESQKQRLMADILDLLKNTRDAISLENERKRMVYGSDWTVEKLIRRKAEIIAAQENASKTRAELRGDIRRPSFQQFEPVPDLYVPPGKPPECGVRWSQTLLHKLPATEVRRLLKLYGETLNEKVRISALKGVQ